MGVGRTEFCSEDHVQCVFYRDTLAPVSDMPDRHGRFV